jgi:ribosome-associated protein
MNISEKLVKIVQHALEDLKAVNTLTLDVRDLASFTDYMIITSGTSSRHVKSIADNVVEEAKKDGFATITIEGHTYGEWVLVDLGDVVVHVMTPATREFYQLEKLWAKHE